MKIVCINKENPHTWILHGVVSPRYGYSVNNPDFNKLEIYKTYDADYILHGIHDYSNYGNYFQKFLFKIKISGKEMVFPEECFITLTESREQRINKILE
jgi:hypothetical protein